LEQVAPRPSTLATVSSSRPAIHAIEQDSDGEDVRVTITLDCGDERHYGQAIGEADPPHRPRLAAEAALRAVEHLIGGNARLELLAVATAGLGQARIALAQIRADDTNDVLVGTAVIREDDPSLAAVRAVMDALNRRLEKLL
jgi:hypothetical protein